MEGVLRVDITSSLPLFLQHAWRPSFVPLSEHMPCDWEPTSLTWGSSQTCLGPSHEYFTTVNPPWTQ